MSQIRIAKAADIGAFPASTFVVNDTPPITQCQETKIINVDSTSTAGLTTITEPGPSWAGINLAGKEVVVTGTAADDGTYTIISNTDAVLTTDHTFLNNENSIITVVQDPGQTYLTRNESSFQRFIENQGKAHTTKGGQLYTDLTDPPMDDACSDTWSPA